MEIFSTSEMPFPIATTSSPSAFTSTPASSNLLLNHFTSFSGGTPSTGGRPHQTEFYSGHHMNESPSDLDQLQSSAKHALIVPQKITPEAKFHTIVDSALTALLNKPSATLRAAMPGESAEDVPQTQFLYEHTGTGDHSSQSIRFRDHLSDLSQKFPSVPTFSQPIPAEDAADKTADQALQSFHNKDGYSHDLSQEFSSNAIDLRLLLWKQIVISDLDPYDTNGEVTSDVSDLDPYDTNDEVTSDGRFQHYHNYEDADTNDKQVPAKLAMKVVRLLLQPSSTFRSCRVSKSRFLIQIRSVVQLWPHMVPWTL
jgi:hypothetical protein